MPGNTSIEKPKCDSNSSVSSSSVSKLFYGLLNSKSGLDLIRNKKCQQSTANNPQLRRSFKLLKAHRSESNLPFKNQNSNQHNDQLSKLNHHLGNQLNDKLTGSLGDLKMKSNQSLINNDSTLLTTAQLANVIPDDDESPPPTPPLRNSSLQKQSLSQTNPMSYPNYNRELPGLPVFKNEEKRRSVSIANRLSPISDDGGFSSFDFNSSPNKRNSISVLNNRNYNNHNNYRNNHSLVNPNNNHNRYSALINNTTQSTSMFHPSSSSNNLSNWNNLPAFDNQFPENNSNLFSMNNQRNSYFSDADQNLELDYQKINANPLNSNNYALSSQKLDNWSSSTSVLSTYTGLASSSTSDYYTASSETITNSPSLSSLNSAICSSINTCNSPPNSNKINNLNRLYSGSSIVNNTDNSSRNVSCTRQFSYPGSHLPATKFAKSPALFPNTGIAVSSLVEKPKRQESKSVLYYIVAKDSSAKTNEFTMNSDVNIVNKEHSEQQIDKENLLKNNITPFSESSSHSNESHFNKYSATNFVNFNNTINEINTLQPHQQNQTDLQTIQKSLHEFYLRHRGNPNDNRLDRQLKQTNEPIQFINKNLINYSSISNDSACSDSSTVSPTESPTLFPNLPSIHLPAKPSFLNMIKKLTPEEEQRLNELKANAIYTNVHFDSQNGVLEPKEEDAGLSLQTLSKELRLSFRERCSPFEKNNSPKQKITENKTKNELKNLNQPNIVKNIARQFDNLSNLNCDLNANRVSPVSNGKVSTPENASNENAASVQNVSAHNSTKLEVVIQESDKLSENSTSEFTNGSKAYETNREEKDDANQSNGEDCKLKFKNNEEKIRLFLEYLHKNEMSKLDYNKIISHIEEVDKVTKLMISLTSRLNKIESILLLRNQQHIELNGVQSNNQSNDSQLDAANKFKQSTSTDSLLDGEKNLFSSILSLSSISLNNLNCNGSAFFASIEMLNSKKIKILDQLEEATQLKQMIERRCKNLNERIINKHFDFTKIDVQPNREFISLKNFNFIKSMRDKHELSLKCKNLEQNFRSEIK